MWNGPVGCPETLGDALQPPAGQARSPREGAAHER